MGTGASSRQASSLAEWALSQPGTAERSEATAAGVGPKAWRFAGEMDEIAATFAGADLPAGFHEAAADIFRRLADLRDRDDVTVEEFRLTLALLA